MTTEVPTGTPTDPDPAVPAEPVPLDADAPDGDAAALHRLLAEAAAADRPDDPPPTAEEVTGRLRMRWVDRRVLRWVVRDGDRLAGHVVLMLPLQDNPQLGIFTVTVHPDSRRRGIGTALLRAVVRAAAADGRRSLVGEAYEGTPGEDFCRAYGLRPVSTERVSLLRLADVDRPDVEAAAAAAHPGYRLERWTGRCPDALVGSYGRAKAAMNDAPVGDMDMAGRTYPPEVIRQEEDTFRAAGGELRVVVAVHEASGEVAALTETVANSSPRAMQEDTAVVPAHRGRGLGLWVKADMLLRLGAERPEVTEILTGNATGNAHMLAINERLGFRPYQAVSEWQAGVPELVARLG